MSTAVLPRSAPATRPKDPRSVRIAVIGAGITGLAAAHRLRELSRRGRSPISVVVLEASDRIGGQIHTERIEGALLEGGPDTMVLAKPAGAALCQRLELQDEIAPLVAPGQAVQILRRGRLTPLPGGVSMMTPMRWQSLLRSPLFSPGGKLRIALERFVPRGSGADESLSSFVTRRFGRELLERVAEPVLACLHTADADRLSLQTILPRFLEMEKAHGSIARAMAHTDAEQRQRYVGRTDVGHAHIGYPRSGFGTIVQALRARLPADCIRTGWPVDDLVRGSLRGDWEIGGPEGNLRVDGVIFACPSYAASDIVRKIDAVLANELAELSYASCATVNLLYRQDAFARPPQSFGFFVPRAEGLPLLACSFVSVKFRDRAPHGHVLLRVFLGGARDPETMELSDPGLARLAHEQLGSIVGVRENPALVRVHRARRAMPQYEVGFWDRRESIVERFGTLPGLFLAGSGLGAFGVPDCIASGEQAALAALEYAMRRKVRQPRVDMPSTN